MQRVPVLICLALAACSDSGSKAPADATDQLATDTSGPPETGLGQSQGDTGTAHSAPSGTSVELVQDVADVLIRVHRPESGPVVVELAYEDGTLLTFPGEVRDGRFEVRLHASCDELDAGSLALNVNVDDAGWEAHELALTGSYMDWEEAVVASGTVVWPDLALVPTGPAIVCQRNVRARTQITVEGASTELTFWAQQPDVEFYVIPRGGSPWYDYNFATFEGARPAGEVGTVLLPAGEYDVIAGMNGDGEGVVVWAAWP